MDWFAAPELLLLVASGNTPTRYSSVLGEQTTFAYLHPNNNRLPTGEEGGKFKHSRITGVHIRLSLCSRKVHVSSQQVYRSTRTSLCPTTAYM